MGAAADGRWRFWIDRGGTFTDVAARRPDGRLVTDKLLSEEAERAGDPVTAGIRRLMGLGPLDPIPTHVIEEVRVGTTVATNALLERKGEPTVLLVTEGFGDLPLIGDQTRPDIFALDIRRPAPLHSRVIEVRERVAADGRVLVPLDLRDVRLSLEKAFADGFRAAAIVLAHGYRFPDHERRLCGLARSIGFTEVVAGHETSPTPRLSPRLETTVADAFLSPVLARGVDRLSEALRGTRLLLMRSNGGLTDARRFRGKDAVLSGPAGGVVGAVGVARAAGFDRVLGFDMGGTSTDVCRWAGEYERSDETVVGGVRLRVPMLSVHTVAAGGGSVCRFDGTRLRVGPESAGASPGPACYRRGGPATVTDCNVVLGKIAPDRFPAVFGPNGDQPLDAAASLARLTEIAEDMRNRSGLEMTPVEVAEGFIKVAVDNMARAIKNVSTRRGHDPATHVLVGFGGAAGQHVCQVADALGVTKVLLHPAAGVLSALGIGAADIVTIRERALEVRLDGDKPSSIGAALDELVAESDADLERRGVPPERREIRRRLKVRVEGTDSPLLVDDGPIEAVRVAFAAAHRSLFGFEPGGRALIVETVLVEAVGRSIVDPEPPPPLPDTRLPRRIAEVKFFSGGVDRKAPLYQRDSLRYGNKIFGPAVIEERISGTIVEAGWMAEVRPRGELLLTRSDPPIRKPTATKAPDPVSLEIFSNLFMSIAERMGFALERTAASVNIKERRDFSCAVFDGSGALIANAPHMPVHLGSMGESVRAVMERASARPGDVFILNDPFAGGTHLPDITAVTPVWDERGTEILFWVASRGHHADVGGSTPGSMPPDSRSIAEEGVLIDVFPLVRDGLFRENAIRELLTSGATPARDPDQNVADLRAQVAANELGVAELRRAAREHGLETVRLHMARILDAAEERTRRAIVGLRGGARAVETDGGARIRVRVEIDSAERRAIVDFTGTSSQQANNFNAPLAVTRAAVLYVFRTLIHDDIPLNEGCLRPIEILVPDGSILSPRRPAAVAAGNVETSQLVVDALLGALGVTAASQGTMNNLTFGDATRQYYETICGGAGAGPDFDGADAVQTHMTNSRLTDPEILEARFPVVVEKFAIRRGSGGRGRHRGGDGVIRRIRFLEPMTLAILSGRRRVAPFGLEGGEPGALGRTVVHLGAGVSDELAPCERIEMKPGDAVTVETPGGGGFGTPIDD